jgi:uncharacterized Zn finger protein (UPF0148 family)
MFEEALPTCPRCGKPVVKKTTTYHCIHCDYMCLRPLTPEEANHAEAKLGKLNSPTHYQTKGKTRVNAVQICRDNGWKVHTILASDKWEHPRKIRSMDNVSITLLHCYPDGRVGKIEDVKSLPVDVRKHRG